MDSSNVDVLVVGGGAAGFFGAIAAAQKGARVLLIEKSQRPLGKVLISGGGRCNVTNALEDPKILIQYYPRGGRELLGPFHRFGSKETKIWFKNHGVRLKTESDGRVFPTTDLSETVATALWETAEKAGVSFSLGKTPSDLKRLDGSFRVAFPNGDTHSAPRLLLATGSAPLGWTWAKTFGHRIVPPVPSLFTFTIQDSRLTDLSGLSVPSAHLTFPGDKKGQKGPLLITHWGLSGPVVLRLSAWGARELFEIGYQFPLRVNWTGGTEPATDAALKSKRQQDPRKLVLADPAVDIPQRLWARLSVAAGVAPLQRWADVTGAQHRELTKQLLAAEFVVKGKSANKDEFVTCGGVDLKEINFSTLESRLCPGLHFAGEILDIDGVTGGFNFQAAWTTGWLAGEAMAEKPTP